MLMTADWKPKRTQAAADMQVLYGHNAELVWYVLEAAEMLRIHPDELRPWLKRVSAPIIRHGIIPDGKAPSRANRSRWRCRAGGRSWS